MAAILANKVKPHWTVSLKRIGACSGAIEWAKPFKSAQAAWDACTDPSWMMFAIGACDDSPASSPSRRKIVACACAFARLTLPNFEKKFPNDKRLHECLDLCERHAGGDETITIEMLRRAAASAGRAADSAGSAAASAWRAAASAGRAAASAWRAAASAGSAAASAWSAADSARRAADSAGSAAASAGSAADSARRAAASAGSAARVKCCDEIRKRYPKPPRIVKAGAA